MTLNFTTPYDVGTKYWTFIKHKQCHQEIFMSNISQLKKLCKKVKILNV